MRLDENVVLWDRKLHSVIWMMEIIGDSMITGWKDGVEERSAMLVRDFKWI